MRMIRTQSQTLYLDKFDNQFSMTSIDGVYVLIGSDDALRIRDMRINDNGDDCEFALQPFKAESDAVKKLKARFDLMPNIIISEYGASYYLVVQGEKVCSILVKNKEGSRDLVRLLIYGNNNALIDKKVFYVSDAIKYLTKIVKANL